MAQASQMVSIQLPEGSVPGIPDVLLGVRTPKRV